ncbi:MAG: aldehyde:ferredoxin oxidoreductase [Candidatus Riflebacteria bacterium]|nr:aldehyde:ferredoxin oxidoreductase [Candidatus Riflebacteria bacterium]
MATRKFQMMDVNLTTGESGITDISDLFDEFLGGTGVATKLLSEMPPGMDSYSAEAPVIFAIGPFDTIFPVATKTVALFKSPLTGNLGESHAGGRLAMAMYGAGIHVLRIRGRAPTLSYLVIDEETAVVKRANSLKGMSALATERMLRDREDSEFKRSIIRIGPAGERLSPIGEVTVDAARHFGRLGLGGVLGSKNLKAIMISGGKYWKIDNKGQFNIFYKKLYDSVVNSPLMKKYHELGTSVNVIPLSKINGMPTRNFSQGSFEGAREISGERFAEKHLNQQIACAHCQVGCIHVASLRERFSAEDQHYKTFKVSYDHELIYAWGSNLSIGSTEEILRLLLIVEKQGWDAISMGTTLAWTVDAYAHGFIGDKETVGLIPAFGDAKTFEKMLGRIISGHNEFYRSLEKGSVFCARIYGGKEYSIAFGGNEAAGYSTGLWGFLGYATGVRHSHLDAAGYSIDQGNISNPQSDEILTRNLYNESVWRMILNSLVICLFARNVYTKEIILEGLDVLGISGWTEDRLIKTSRHIHALKYKFKEDCGFKFEDQELPGRLLRTVTSSGMLSSERFRTEIDRYKSFIADDRRSLGI